MRRAASAATLVLAAVPALAADPVPPPPDPEAGVAVTVYSTPGGYDPNNIQNSFDP